MRFLSVAVVRFASTLWHHSGAVLAQLRLKHHWLKPLRLLLFLSSLLLCLWLGRGGAVDRALAYTVNRSHQIATTPAAEASWLLQQGLERDQKGDVQGAIAHWQAALRLTVDPASPVRATILKYLVRAEQQVGAVEQAIAHLTQLIAHYQQTGNTVQVGRMLTEQAQAYSSLGRQRNAIALLCHDEPDPMNAVCTGNSALAIARDQSDTIGEIAALGSLGNAHRLRGEYERALQDLQIALKLATQMQSQPQRFAALNGLGNTYASLAKRDDRRRQEAQQSADGSAAQAFAQTARRYDGKAIASFEASLTIAHAQNDPGNELRSLLNLIEPLWRRGEKGEGRGVGRQRRQRGQNSKLKTRNSKLKTLPTHLPPHPSLLTPHLHHRPSASAIAPHPVACVA